MNLRSLLINATLSLSICTIGVSVTHAASIAFDFTDASFAPILSDVPTGVTVSNLMRGSGMADLDDNGAAPGTIRILSSEIGSSTGTALSNEDYLYFTLTVPADVYVDLTGLSLDSKSSATTSYFNARVLSDVHGFDDVVGDTIGIVGRTSSSSGDSDFVTQTIDLASPTTSSYSGANVSDGDFDGLTDRSITFYFPWIDMSNTASVYMDIDNLVLSFSESSNDSGTNPDGPEDPQDPGQSGGDFSISEIRFPGASNVALTLSAPSASDYFVFCSDQLIGPIYRKRWTEHFSGTMPSNENTVSLEEVIPSASQAFYVATDEAPRARIMCVGDSITEGSSYFYVYRPYLYSMLSANGYRFEFVGSKSNTMSGITLKHEGYSGQNAEQVAGHFASNYPNYPADIVLIHSGHNYDASVYTVSSIIDKVDTATRSMIASARSHNPNVIILLAQVVTSNKLPKYSYIPALNATLADTAEALNTPEQPVLIVNQADGWDPDSDTIDDLVHPNETGAQKMAVKWFETLAPWLE